MFIIALIVFTLLYLYVANRHVARPFWNIIRGKKLKTEKVKDKRILDSIKIKTGVHLDYFLLFDDPFTLGMMAGIPGKPQMFLSQRTYTGDYSQKDEQEWVLMHETGHYVLGHSVKEGIYELIFLVIGIAILLIFHNFIFQLITSIILAVLLGLLTIKIGKYHEYEAEDYALKKVTNPQGMIEAGKRGITDWKRAGLPERSILHRLFDRWEMTMYYQRMVLAKKEIGHRREKKK